MRVAIDARAADGPPTGIRWYLRTLVQALAALPDEHQYLLLRHAPRDGRSLTQDPRFAQLDLPSPADLWIELHVEEALGDWEADLYHSPFAPVPAVRPCPGVMTVHDIIPRVFPELVGEAFSHYFQERLVPGFRRCEQLIAVSQHTAHDLAHLYGLPPHRISVAAEAAPPEHLGPVDANAAGQVLAHLDIRRPYFLCVGAVEPRKNISRLLDALALLRTNGGDRARLVVVGAARDQADRVARKLRTAGDSERVLWLEQVGSDQLRAIYSQALALVFPSLYEGFGLPVLEAMSHGLPVIVSRVSALPELVGEAGLLVDPYDIEDLARAMRVVWEQEELRRDLGAQAGARAEQFSMRQMGEATLRAYRRAREG